MNNHHNPYDALEQLAARLIGGQVHTITTDALGRGTIAGVDAAGRRWQVGFSGPAEVYDADAGDDPLDDGQVAGATITDILWDATWLVVAAQRGRTIHIRLSGALRAIDADGAVVMPAAPPPETPRPAVHQSRATPPMRAYRFGYPRRTTAIASLCFGLLYRLLLAGAAQDGTTAATRTPLAVVGAVGIALAIAAATARREARFAGLPWPAYEQIVGVALGVLLLVLIV